MIGCQRMKPYHLGVFRLRICLRLKLMGQSVLRLWKIASGAELLWACVATGLRSCPVRYELHGEQDAGWPRTDRPEGYARCSHKAGSLALIHCLPSKYSPTMRSVYAHYSGVSIARDHYGLQEIYCLEDQRFS